MSIEKKNFVSKKEYSMETIKIRPEELMSELGIKKSKYYEVLKELGLKADKDLHGRSYLTIEQAEQIKNYLLNNMLPEENQDSNNNCLVKVDDSNLTTSTENNSVEDIYIDREEPSAQLDSKIVREAEELAARGMAMNDLIKIQLASQMSFEDLSPDLQEKVNIAREVANPKWTPAQLAETLLSQHRNSLRGN
jgi:hypothetical protein